jgi:hypothetical protein
MDRHVEAEFTPKPLTRTVTIMRGLLARTSDYGPGAPAALTERLLAAFDIKAIYNRDKHQATIHATITDATPRPS